VPATPAKSADGASADIELKPNADDPFAGLVFKIVADKPVDLYYLRVYSGTLRSGSRVLNAATGKKENIARMYRMFAKKRGQTDYAIAGDIVAVIGPKDALTGHTLCDPRRPVLLESIEFPETVISRSIEPKSSRDRDRLFDALRALGKQDPTFNVRTSSETGQVLISGMGELHLDVLVRRLQDELKVEVNVGQPRVSYRETITRAAEADGKFIREMGGRSHFAIVKLRLEPVPRGSSHAESEFVSELPDGTIRPEFVAAIEQGVHDAALGGIVNGSPVIQWRAILVDAKEHETDSSEIAFEHAASIAFENATRAGDAVLLEPIMKVEVVVPNECFGTVNSDLNSRRATITATDMRGSQRIVDADVPLKELFGYTTALRSLTQGRAHASMEMSHYAPVQMSVSS
jgi:elongation factor G